MDGCMVGCMGGLTSGWIDEWMGTKDWMGGERKVQRTAIA